ncbi:MAG: hypothetical protein SGPRY_001824 [Prymnesium sp.]
MAEVRRLCCCLGVPLLLLARLPCVISQVRHGQRGGMTTKHEANKYQLYLDRLRAIVDKVVGEAGVVISVPTDPTQWQTPHGPRLGAFELQLFYTEQGSLRSEVLHSKLATKKWPSTAKLEAALLRQVGPSRSVESNGGTEYAVASAVCDYCVQVHTIRIHPVVMCADGFARGLVPLPSLKLLKSASSQQDAAGSTIAITKEHNWISTRLPRGSEDCFVQVDDSLAYAGGSFALLTIFWPV